LSAVPSVTGGGSLFGVAAIRPDDVWAVGSTGDATAGLEHALALHWDGLAWTAAALHVGQGRSLLADVSAVSSSDVWPSVTTTTGRSSSTSTAGSGRRRRSRPPERSPRSTRSEPARCGRAEPPSSDGTAANG